MRLTITVRHDPADDDLLLDLEPETPIAQLATALGYGVDDLWVGDERVGGAGPVGGSAIRTGSVVTLAGPVIPRPETVWPWQLLVVGGPCSGTVHRLRSGIWTLGRAGDPLLPDPSASRRHLKLTVSADAVVAEDLGSANGTDLDGRGVRGPFDWSPGQVVRVGDSLLSVDRIHLSDAALAPADDGTITFNRPPRLLPMSRRAAVLMPAEPAAEHRRTVPVLTMLAPAVVGVVMAVVLRNPLYLLLAVMSPLIGMTGVITERRAGRKSHRAQRAEYESKLAVARDRLETARLAERAARRDDHPDPANTLLTAELPGRRLWERRRHDEDAFVVRVGTAALPATIEVTTHGAGKQVDDTPEVLVEDVPVVVPLREIGVLGIAGAPAAARAVGRWVVAQLAVRHRPSDLTTVVLTDHGAGADWGWLRWLPHARPSDGHGPTALIGNDRETVRARIAELGEVVAQRLAALDGQPADPELFGAVLVVLDGSRTLRSMPGMAPVLRNGPSVGVFIVCLDEQERLLPTECQAVVAFDPADATRARVSMSRGSTTEDVLIDQVSAAWAERVARPMCPLRDVTGEEQASRLPTAARLLDELAMPEPTSGVIAARWTVSGRSTRAVIGVDDHGPFVLDLSAHGPHGLIAGTTGSGKSELLQTIVASLAVANRPEAMTFVLVDYKGGSAFKDCVRLPHTVGMVTDLDTSLVERALTSLKAELYRREHLLAEFGAKDLEDYVDLGAGNDRPPLPRLLLVIDEFASLARELPDFVSGLVSIAERGRSLGIHLLLATQRPSGVVSDAIRANTNLRIALRVTDDADSLDVISAVDAARIPKSTPGRAFARLGHSTLVGLQSARIGGRRPGTTAAATRPPFIAPLTWDGLGYAPPEPPRTPAPESTADTDLSVLVAAIGEAGRTLAIPPQHSPWLPALPASLTLDALPPTESGPFDLVPVPYGLEDLPADQAQRTLTFDLARHGHLFAIGGPRTGRSQLLRTLAGSGARLHTTDDLHMFGLDCGNGALLPLAGLPHVGAVVQRTESDRAARLLARLEAEIERRQHVLGAGGFADITEQRQAAPAEGRLPHLLVLLDRWEGFLPTLGEVDNGSLLDAVVHLLREGASVGVHAVITGDRTLLSGRVAPLADDRLAFRLADRGDYTMLGLNPRSLPEEIPAGRAHRAEAGTQIQIALLAVDASGTGQAAAIELLGERSRERDAAVPQARRPFRVDVLPRSLSFEHAWDLREGPTGPLFGLVGVGGDELRAMGPDLGSGAPTFVVTGPPRSGRSTLLLSMIRSFLAGSAMVIAVAPRVSPLRHLVGTPGVLDLWTEPELTTEALDDMLDRAGSRPVVVVIDDAEDLHDCPAGSRLAELSRGGRAATGVVLAGDPNQVCRGFTGWQTESKKARRGALLAPQGLGDGDVIGVRLPRSAVGGPVEVGLALYPTGEGGLARLRVPNPGVVGR